MNQDEHKVTFKTEELNEIARSVAGSQTITSKKYPYRNLLKGLESSRTLLTDAYKIFAGALKANEEISSAAEWLIDNFYIIQEQFVQIEADFPEKFQKSVPRLETGPNTGYPRVYELVQNLVMYSDNEVSEESLKEYIQAFQEIETLNIGEIWAVPVVLRFILIEQLAEKAGLVLKRRKLQPRINNLVNKLSGIDDPEPGEFVNAISEAIKKIMNGENEQALMAEMAHQLQNAGFFTGDVKRWFDYRFRKFGMSTDEALRIEAQVMSRYQVSIQNGIQSLRKVSEIEWNEFVEECSIIDKILSLDPAGTYPEMDFNTRDMYRGKVEQLSRGTGFTETEISEKVLIKAEKYQEKPATLYSGLIHSTELLRSHVGFYLIGDGNDEICREIGYKKPVSERIKKTFEKYPVLYLGAVGITSVIFLSVLWVVMELSGFSFIFSALTLLASFFPALDLSITTTNRVFAWYLPPRILPKMDFENGIPEESRTMVVVPTLLNSPDNARKQVEGLEVKSLANPDRSLQFVLLSDFTDSSEKEVEKDKEILESARKAISELNRKYRSLHGDKFYLLHRERIWNEREESWMGWERKRGKIEQLNRLLCNPGEEIPFKYIEGDFFDSIRKKPVKFVITLDADTKLPPESAKKLAATISHPLNRAVCGQDKKIVERGYGIIQPRISINPESARSTFFSRIYSGNVGIDPYSTAVSDIYQDLCGEAVFTGKGIYDVEAFFKLLDKRFPENRILSHDLIESNYLRAGLATDIELYDDYPSNYFSFSMRNHRWVRGDWQIAGWLFSKIKTRDGKRRNELNVLSKWKIFDNLRRSLNPQFLLLFLCYGWFVYPGKALFWLIAFLGIVAFPIYISLSSDIANRPARVKWKLYSEKIRLNLKINSLQFITTLMTLPHQAYLMCDAAIRSIWRVSVSGKKLLEWKAASYMETVSENSLKRSLFFHLPSVLFGAGIFSLSVILEPAVLWITAPLSSLWIASPYYIWEVNKPALRQKEPISNKDKSLLRIYARKTWFYFERFVNEENSWLPPDNFQESPYLPLTNRTSPTNMGLALSSTISAYHFGYLTFGQMLNRIENSLNSMVQLERYKGHFYNWYDTKTGEVLNPKYISTVDSGNLAAGLIVINEALDHLWKTAGINIKIWDGLSDTILSVEEIFTSLNSDEMLAEGTFELVKFYTEKMADKVQKRCPENPEECIEMLKSLKEDATELSGVDLLPSRNLLGDEQMEALLFWMDSPLLTIESYKAEMECFADKMASLKKIPLSKMYESVLKVNKNNRTCEKLKRWNRQIEKIRFLIEGLLSEMDFSFLYLEKRKLFSIGYNVEKARADEGTYDLLASEARIASFIAISKGDVPVEHWFRLGRRLTSLDRNEILLSWGGTMFEYLMPSLFMRSLPNSLLSHTYNFVVQWQMRYASKRGLPWGQSESAYYFLNINKHYQYRAFGAPGLGLKRGLAEDYVVAPYATFLALMIAPKEAISNLKQLVKLGGCGLYGFYDSIDFSPLRQKENEQYKVVKTYMGHHHGMSLLAVDNILHGWKIHHYFHSDLRTKGCELLLQERVPRGIPVKEPHPIEVEMEPGDQQKVQRVVEHAGMNQLDMSPPKIQILTNGVYSVTVTHTGTGFSECMHYLLTKRSNDSISDQNGLLFYIRDKSSGEFWSAGHQPARKKPDRYDTWFHNDKAVTSRVDHWIETTMETTVSSNNNAELRRLTLTNYSDRKRELEIFSYAEVVLQEENHYRAHPAFSKLFLQTEYLPQHHALLVKRRPGSKEESTPWLYHVVTVDELEDLSSPLQFETERSEFLGRGRSTVNPRIFDNNGDLSGTAGNVTDPIVSLKKTITLEPGEKKQLTYCLGMAADRDEAVYMADLYDNFKFTQREYSMASVYSDIELEHLGITPKQAHYYTQMASLLLYPESRFRAKDSLLRKNRKTQKGLWVYGISGDMPILIFKLSDSSRLKYVESLLKAHSFWRQKGVECELVILNEHLPGYVDELNESVLNLIELSRGSGWYQKRGGIFLLQVQKIPEEDLILLQTAATVVFENELPEKPLEPVNEITESWVEGNENQIFSPLKPEGSLENQIPSGLKFYNGFGGFSTEDNSYCIILNIDDQTKSLRLPPSVWTHVVSNHKFGFITTERGGGYTWSRNSRENKLTEWSNDAVLDPHSEVIYLRDEHNKTYWSLTPGPVPGSNRYKVIYGFGYATYSHESSGLHVVLTQFAASHDPVKISLIEIENRSENDRELSLFSYINWVMGVEKKSSRYIISKVGKNGSRIFQRNYYNNEFAGSVAFRSVSSSQNFDGTSYTTDRQAFIGKNRSCESPYAIENKQSLDNTIADGNDSCTALQSRFKLEKGKKILIVLLTGEGNTVEHAGSLIEKFSDIQASISELSTVKDSWNQKLGKIRIQAPDESLNVMMNGWLSYQNLACRMMARTAFYQAGGAFGFRDQLQDAMAALYVDPGITRDQILLHASRQFPEGDVQHWWHPPTGRGVRTRISDDRLWLPYVTMFYINATGDRDILNEEIRFIEARQLNENEHEAYLEPELSDIKSSLYDHCCRAVDVSLEFGEHGLPLMGGGDWNDGMNKVGEKGRGESAWLGFFMYSVLNAFIEACSWEKDTERENIYREAGKKLKSALNQEGWDGKWYLRAFYDDGTPLGSSMNEECKIDAISQAWSVISNASDLEKGKQALRSAENYLVSEENRIIRLLTPPFDKTEKNPGYIRGYIPGVRENGGQYTHGALWVIKAIAESGEPGKAYRYLSMINPVNHTRTIQNVRKYGAEPYVVAADVYGEFPLTGKAGWTWYTGSGGWMYRVILESFLGFSYANGKILLKPQLPGDWGSFKFYVSPAAGTKFECIISNPNHVENGHLKLIEKKGEVSLRISDKGAEINYKEGMGEILLKFQMTNKNGNSRM